MRQYRHMLCTFLYIFDIATGTLCFHNAPAACAICIQEKAAGSSSVTVTRFFERCNAAAEPQSKIIRYIANWRICLSPLSVLLS
jgi:hypothetical protein